MNVFKRIARWFKSSDDYADEYKAQNEINQISNSYSDDIWRQLNALDNSTFARKLNGNKSNSSEAEAVNQLLQDGPANSRDYYTRLHNAARAYENAKNKQRFGFIRWAGVRTEGKKRLGYAKYIQRLIAQSGKLDGEEKLKLEENQQGRQRESDEQYDTYMFKNRRNVDLWERFNTCRTEKSVDKFRQAARNLLACYQNSMLQIVYKSLSTAINEVKTTNDIESCATEITSALEKYQ